MKSPTKDDLRRYAVSRSLFAPTTLRRAIDKLGFVQADPIRAPARAQDLTLRHRVRGYRAGDLERRYAALDLEEDVLVNYGFLPRRWLDVLHPREPRRPWDDEMHARARRVLAFVRDRGPTHPREVDAHFTFPRTVGYWGNVQSASTLLLDSMHYRGILRVARREGGIRIYEVAPERAPTDASPAERARRLVDLVIGKYAPLPQKSLGYLAQLLRYGAPQLREHIRRAVREAPTRLPHTEIDGVTWLWPEGDDPRSARHDCDDRARLLAPFDPVVWDRHRFELLWGWTYRFEAYTPPAKRKLGYYAMPLLHGERVVGWGNVSVEAGRLVHDLGLASGKRATKALRSLLDEDLEALRTFLGL